MKLSFESEISSSPSLTAHPSQRTDGQCQCQCRRCGDRRQPEEVRSRGSAEEGQQWGSGGRGCWGGAEGPGVGGGPTVRGPGPATVRRSPPPAGGANTGRGAPSARGMPETARSCGLGPLRGGSYVCVSRCACLCVWHLCTLGRPSARSVDNFGWIWSTG